MLMDNLNTIFFVCMSKNCFDSLQKNLNFLFNFKEKSQLDIKIFIVDSDSVDGTKEYSLKLEEELLVDKFIEIDNLEINYSSRIERLTICRNSSLMEMKEYNLNQVIYVPIDSDIFVFEHTNIDDFENIINQLIENNIWEGVFPFSIPYYYDIFALRKPGWVDGNNLLQAKQRKQKIKFGSFFINYFYIFRKQVDKDFFKQKKIKVNSAFGGIGIYKIKDIQNLKYTYLPDFQNIDFVSEHINFNLNFKNLYILKDWNIPAPKGYVYFKNSNFKDKLIYILKTIKNDFKN